jgi:hypothetical protein
MRERDRRKEKKKKKKKKKKKQKRKGEKEEKKEQRKEASTFCLGASVFQKGRNKNDTTTSAGKTRTEGCDWPLEAVSQILEP